MLKIISSALFGTFDDFYEIDYYHSKNILDTIERAGMLPPGNTGEFHGAVINVDNYWEPEDAT